MENLDSDSKKLLQFFDVTCRLEDDEKYEFVSSALYKDNGTKTFVIIKNENNEVTMFITCKKYINIIFKCKIEDNIITFENANINDLTLFLLSYKERHCFVIKKDDELPTFTKKYIDGHISYLDYQDKDYGNLLENLKKYKIEGNIIS